VPLIDFSTAYTGGPSFYTGTGTTALVPDVFPVAINGRPYLIDSKSGRFTRQFDARVRDSQDNSTAPGEAAISPQGLWRRGQNSWHFGAGQKYADSAASQDYRFYKSKGVNPWTRGQLTLLNATLLSKSSAATESHMVVQDGRVYASLNGDVFYSTNPFSTSATWTACTGEPGGTCQAMATDGNDVYLAFPSDGVRKIDTSVDAAVISGTKYVNSNDNYYMLGFAKNFMWGAYNHKLATISSGGSKTDHIVPDDLTFTWVGVATGQNAVYAAGYSGKKSLVYKITIKADGTLDAGVVALELPTGEVATAISGYLGAILLGTNKGVRYCSTDSDSNLVAGAIIPTSSDVKKFSSNDRFTYFTWTNYDGTSGGIGRLDLSVFTAANTPAFATDLMYSSTADIKNLVIFEDKPVFTVSGVGIVAQDTANLVTSGTIETGRYTWGIPDRKFAPRFDIRVEPLVGSISAEVAINNGAYESIGIHNDTGDTEHTFLAPEDKFIDAGYRLTLTRATALTGPTFSRWMARAYAAPARSRLISVPVLLHSVLRAGNKDYYLDVENERDLLDNLVTDPRIVTYQEKGDTYSVIVEDIEWQALDVSSDDWLWEGTAVVIMRTVTE
jgi:hypothetical protein